MADFTPYNPRQATHSKGSSLPQWRQENAIYFITFRLADSLPNPVTKDWDIRRRAWLLGNLTPEIARKLATHAWDPSTLDVPAALDALSATARRAYEQTFTAEWHQFLDAGYGNCVLREPTIRKAVADSLLHFDGTEYELLPSVIMPNHVHVLVKPISQALSKILQAWKSCSARKINQHQGSSGSVWMRESFNRIVRSEANLESYKRYVLANPSKAGLRVAEYTLLKL